MSLLALIRTKLPKIKPEHKMAREDQDKNGVRSIKYFGKGDYYAL